MLNAEATTSLASKTIALVLHMRGMFIQAGVMFICLVLGRREGSVFDS